MKITTLSVESDEHGDSKVKVWADCHTIDDIDDMIAWLELAKSLALAWHVRKAKKPPAVALVPKEKSP